MHGLTFRVTSDGVPVVRVHYSADAAKRPGTPEGDAWLANALRGVVGGIVSARWRREMEIDYGALGGTLVFPGWASDKRRICIPPFSPKDLRLYGIYDHGWRNPASFLVIGQDRDALPTVIWQFYGSYVTVPQIAKLIKGEKSVVSRDGVRFLGNPHHNDITRIWADPSIWKEDQNMDDGTVKSVAELFRRQGVYMSPAQRGGDTMVAGWLTEMWADLEQPGCKIMCPPNLVDVDQGFVNRGYAGPGAPCLVWELGRLRFRDWSEAQQQHHDFKEEIEDRDNHAWDCLKMYLHEFPPRAPKQPVKATAGTLNWFREQRKRVQRGMAPRTFSVGT